MQTSKIGLKWRTVAKKRKGKPKPRGFGFLQRLRERDRERERETKKKLDDEHPNKEREREKTTNVISDKRSGFEGPTLLNSRPDPRDKKTPH